MIDGAAHSRPNTDGAPLVRNVTGRTAVKIEPGGVISGNGVGVVRARVDRRDP